MRRKILLPTDFSMNSRQAIQYALELYKNEACDFYLMNAFSVSGSVMSNLKNIYSGSELFHRAKDQSEKGLSDLFDTLVINEDSDSKHHFKMISVQGDIIDAVKNVVEEKDIEMIVMGTKGETYAKGVVFGSAATYVMEKVRNCPVIVVPKKANIRMPKEIVFPTDYKTYYKRRELKYLTEIANKCDATIAILHIMNEDELDTNQVAHKQMLEEIFEEVSYSFHELSNYSVEAAVNIFTESRDSDMVAFINKKHAFFGSILTNPMVKSIAFHSKVPILVMHDLRN